MLLQVINPNSTAAMTDAIAATARGVAAVGTSVSAVTNTGAPASLQSHTDEALAVPGMLAAVAAGERAGVDGHVIACFGDPGLDAAREVARGPVVGIAEAAMHLATMLGRGFSVVTTLGRTRARAQELAVRYGMAEACRAVRACEVPVLELDGPGSAAEQRVLAECRAALAEDDADVIVLGCAGMADLTVRLGQRLGVPVVDGVTAATVLAQSLVTLGLATSTRQELAPLPADTLAALDRAPGTGAPDPRRATVPR
ncbi:aspartate/glutamate racemase family protein [Modestobacter sp. I12A-02628]|uniref:Aspartate/glutamate racemase family protein n=1 Tax=Goekera deserti TaxID=2497753 RepID=A0A7K3WBM3_9ACTN|nr:aspartate/glutamate racemase family protein [Goekera deserti]MPQ98894.1 aspartate/glutamate racemase family protein [Goekera deserti]NDI49607.1 aspartate/glutamate racemase family protein [Goekera deserti]NEL53200.1 aspartate/glutamate racemase family protein [Goekera deserti]